jgi:hypothetical protein
MMAQQSKPTASVAAKAGYRCALSFLNKRERATKHMSDIQSILRYREYASLLLMFILNLDLKLILVEVYSDAYAEGWDRIFGKKDDASSSAKVDSEAVAASVAGSSK